MAPGYSTLRFDLADAYCRVQQLAPIPLAEPPKSTVCTPKVTLSYLRYPDQPYHKTTNPREDQDAYAFNIRTPEQYCAWRAKMDEVFASMPVTEVSGKFAQAARLLDEPTCQKWAICTSKYGVMTEREFLKAVNDFGKQFMKKTARRDQKRFMRSQKK